MEKILVETLGEISNKLFGVSGKIVQTYYLFFFLSNFIPGDPVLDLFPNWIKTQSGFSDLRKKKGVVEYYIVVIKVVPQKC